MIRREISITESYLISGFAGRGMRTIIRDRAPHLSRATLPITFRFLDEEGAGMSGERRTATYCRVCEPACGLVATVRDGELVALEPDRDHPVSRGFACRKG